MAAYWQLNFMILGTGLLPFAETSFVPIPDDDFLEMPARYPPLNARTMFWHVGSVGPLAFRKAAAEWQRPICIADIGGGKV